MKVKDLIALLAECDLEADFEVRGTVNGDYAVISEDIGVDDCGDLVVLDI